MVAGQDRQLLGASILECVGVSLAGEGLSAHQFDGLQLPAFQLDQHPAQCAAPASSASELDMPLPREWHEAYEEALHAPQQPSAVAHTA